MYAIELPAEIDKNHQIHLQLPQTVTAGKVKVIVMYEETTQPDKPNTLGLSKEKIPISDEFNKPLLDFLNELSDVPENAGLSRDEIQKYIQQERQCWDS